MSIRIVEISVSEHLADAAGVLAENWGETGFDFDLKPDAQMLTAMERAGAFFVVGAFDGDQVVGYSAAFVTPHHFNPEVIVCSTSALFVRAAYRCGITGARLIRETERVAKERGANRICWNTRAGTPLASMLAARGYTPADVVVLKGL